MRSFRTLVTGRHAASRCLLALVACLFLCRALIPAGYMPDAEALRDGRIVLTLCTADGSVRSVALDLGLEDEPSAAALDCPFGPASSWAYAPAPDALWPLALPAHADRPAPWALAIRPPQPAQGPPLGSRAPPLSLFI